MKALSALFFVKNSKLISEACSVGYLKPEQLRNFGSNDCQVEASCKQFSSSLASSNARTKGFRLLVAFLLTVKWSWLVVFLGKLLLTSCIILGPLLTNSVLSALRLNLGVTTVLQSLVLLLLQKAIKSLLATHIDFLQYKMGCTFYGQLALQIYEKSMLSSRGKTLNLLEEDGYRLINLPYFLVELIVVPLQIGYGVYALCWAVGLRLLRTHLYIFLVYILMCLLLVCVDIRLNRKLMGIKDRRSEVLLDYLANRSESAGQGCLKARASQLQAQKCIFAVEVTTRSLSSMICSLMLVVALISFSEQLTQGQVFSLILLFNELRYPCMQLPMLISNFVQEYVSLARIEDILNIHQNRTNTLGSSLTESLIGNAGPINYQPDQIEWKQPNSSECCTGELIQLPSLTDPTDYVRIDREVAVEISEFTQSKQHTLHHIFLLKSPDPQRMDVCLANLGLEQADVSLEGYLSDPSPRTTVLIAIVRQLYHTRRLLLTNEFYDKAALALGEEYLLQLLAKILKHYSIYTHRRLLNAPNKEAGKVAEDYATPEAGVEPPNTIEDLPNAEHHARGSIGWSTYSSYLKFSQRGFMMVLFAVCCVAAQSLSVYSTLMYRKHTQDSTITFRFESLLFLTPFLSILPTAGALLCILAISLRASKNLFCKVIKGITQITATFQTKVVANRLSNDLKFFDKNFCLCIFDISFTGCSILGSVGLCLLGLVMRNYLWMLGTLAILLVIAASMYLLNQRAMWAIRQCLRLEATSRTLSIGVLYDCSRYSRLINYFGQEDLARNRYITLVNSILRIHLAMISTECWFELRLLLLSLAGCTVMCGISLLLELEPSMIGITMSYTFALDDLFQTFFLNAISLEKAGVAVQRCLALLQPL